MRRGSYTTARILRGRVTRMERHVARLRRDAARLGLDDPDPREIEQLFCTTARDVFGQQDGIVRVEWAVGPEGRLRLAAETRPYSGSAESGKRAGGDPSPPRWSAISAVTLHPGPEPLHGAKGVDFDPYASARRESGGAGTDEALLFDRHDRLIEGARSNLIVVMADGTLLTPALEYGPVEGLGLSLARESSPELAMGRIERAALRTATELIAVNAVRGAIPIVSLDGRAVGRGEPGPWVEILADRLGFD